LFTNRRNKFRPNLLNNLLSQSPRRSAHTLAQPCYAFAGQERALTRLLPISHLGDAKHMTPRQARGERREAERKPKKLEFKKARQPENYPLAAVKEFPEIQPRWNPELEDEFPREVQIRNNAIMDRRLLEAGLPIPPPGPTPGPRSDASIEEIREYYRNKQRAKGLADSPPATPKPQHPQPQPPAETT
jgi:hypothetical protein